MSSKSFNQVKDQILEITQLVDSSETAKGALVGVFILLAQLEHISLNENDLSGYELESIVDRIGDIMHRISYNMGDELSYGFNIVQTAVKTTTDQLLEKMA